MIISVEKNILRFTYDKISRIVKCLNLINRSFRGNSQTPVFSKSSTGFTLIELLVVIVIIGVISTILYSGIVGARQRARDTRRKQDLQQIQTALEFYRSENGIYPAQGAYGIYSAPCPTPSVLKSPDGTKTYMEKIPCDPRPPVSSVILQIKKGNYYYADLSGNNSTYVLLACVENINDKESFAQYPVCPSDRGAYYIYNQ